MQNSSEFDGVIIEKDWFSLGTDRMSNYVAHVYCSQGSCVIGFNDRDILIKQNDCAIFPVTKLVYNIRPGSDFKVEVIYVSNEFTLFSSPDSNYYVRGVTALYHNPVIALNSKDARLCRNGFQCVEYRLKDKNHNFYKEALSSALRSLFLDFFDFHARVCSGEKYFSSPQADLMIKYLSILEQGGFKTHRDISYYADKLCVSSKYLSATSKKISGLPASSWINRFTVLELQRYLKDNAFTLSQIAEEFCFSSSAYLSRYVQRHLGRHPSAYRAE